jgi:hypothetical protein
MVEVTGREIEQLQHRLWNEVAPDCKINLTEDFSGIIVADNTGLWKITEKREGYDNSYTFIDQVVRMAKTVKKGLEPEKVNSSTAIKIVVGVILAIVVILGGIYLASYNGGSGGSVFSSGPVTCQDLDNLSDLEQDRVLEEHLKYKNPSGTTGSFLAKGGYSLYGNRQLVSYCRNGKNKLSDFDNRGKLLTNYESGGASLANGAGWYWK